MPVDKVRKRDIFQSTPPRGRRRYHKRGDTVMQIISIHSAARAETVLFNHKRDYVADFNPLRREGGDNRLMSGRS